MSEFGAQEIKARIALRDLEEKTKLLKIIKKQGNLLMGLYLAIVITCLAILHFMKIDSDSIPPVVNFCMLMITLMLPISLIGIINHRFNSLVKFLELDKNLLKKEESGG